MITNTTGSRLNISGGTLSASNTAQKTYLIDNPSGATVNITGGTVANNCYVAGATTEFLAINNNGTTTLTYVNLVNGVASEIKKLYYPIPKVKGYLEDLKILQEKKK